jgi:peptidoglycan/LPS O-acetylase OafA/YrhL
MNPPAANSTESLVRSVMPELDTLRGVAILLVVFFHGFGIQGAMFQLKGAPRVFVTLCVGGWTGVYLFFVLSGFLITGILLDSKTRPDYYRRFYIRRALRILPAFYALLILLAVLPRTGLFEGRRADWPFLWLSFFYLANLVDLFGVSAQYAALWSLAVEEHFYLLWPTVIRLFSRRVVAWCALAIFVLCPVLRGVECLRGHIAVGGYTWLVADALAPGALLAVLARGPLGDRKAMRQFSLICIFAAIALFGFGTPFGIWFGTRWFGVVFRPTGVTVFFTGLLGITLLLGTGRWKWIVQRPILQWFGEISYGLYLIHMLAFDFVNHWIRRLAPGAYAQLPSRFGLLVLRFILIAALAVFVAYLSRCYFEERFLRLKDRWTHAASASPGPAGELEATAAPVRQTA